MGDSWSTCIFLQLLERQRFFLSIIERVLIIHVKILVVIPCWITKLKKITNLSGSKGSLLTIFGRLWNDCKFFVYLHLICTQQLIAPAAWSDFIINSLLKFRFEVVWKNESDLKWSDFVWHVTKEPSDCSPVTRWHCSFIWNEMIPTIPRVLTDQYLRLLSDIFRKFPDHVGTSRSEFECPVNFPGIPNQLGKASRRRNLYKKNPFQSYFLLIWPKIRPSNVITAAKM